MKVGDLVKFVEPTHGKWLVREDTSGIVLGFHPKNGRPKVQWFTMGNTPTPDRPGFWPWGSLKVYSESR